MRSQKRVKLAGFILLETLLYLNFLYIDIYNSEEYKASSIIKFIGILCCLLFSLFVLDKRINRSYVTLIRTALLFTVISDVFLLLTNESEKGVFTFCFVQGIYRYYLYLINKENVNNDGKLNFLFLPNLIVWIILMFGMYILKMPINFLLGITTLYFVSIVINVIVSIITVAKIKEASLIVFAVGMVLFLLCDINVGIFNMGDFLPINNTIFQKIYNFSTVGMWLFYLPAQVLLASSLLFIKEVREC